MIDIAKATLVSDLAKVEEEINALTLILDELRQLQKKYVNNSAVASALLKLEKIVISLCEQKNKRKVILSAKLEAYKQIP